jgi:hypothetical protein
MNLKYITCSDPRESLQINDLIELTKISPKVEIGMQSHPSAMMSGLDRNIWFNQFLDWAGKQKTPVNIAMHVNYQWCDKMCTGIIPNEIAKWMQLRNVHTDAPVIKRWQLNIGDGTNNFDAEKIARLIEMFPENDFLFPFNPYVQSKISALYKTNAKFSLMYDSSYGYGICPDRWNPPVYNDRNMGYAGGLSPENVAQNLEKISQVVPKDYTTWIDAEGKLMKPNSRTWDMKNVTNYVKNALAWEANQKTK